MGKKRNKANKNIEELINELIGYQQAFVGSANCPYVYNLLGADKLKKPEECHKICCENCKEHFYENINEELRKRYIVK